MKRSVILLFLCTFYIVTTAQVAFEQNIVVDDRHGVVHPRGSSTADIDNDGFEDLLIAGYGDVAWARSIDGAGNFENARSFVTEFIEANNIEAADFDGDNDLDVVIYARGDNSSYEVLYAENTDGIGTFAAPITLASTASIFDLNFQVLDIDNDGDIDIAYSSGQNISWLENTDGQATFTNHYLLGGNEGFYTIDLDGDGISDFISDDDYDLRAYKLNADGTLSFIETMNTFSLNNDHKAGDIDGDDDNDVVTFFENGSTRQIHWYENTDGLGTFANRQVLFDLPSISSFSNSDQKGLEIVDIDNDNMLDIVTFESKRNGMSWYKNLGGGVFAAEQIISDDILTITSITISDLDNDGAADILFTDYINNEYSWFRNQDGLGDFGDLLRISSYALFVNHVDYADIDGDGDLDLVSSSHADNKVAWYENTNGQGDFSNRQQVISGTTNSARDVFALDMDGDTDMDLLFFTYVDAAVDEYQIIWFENDGTGNFPTEHVVETTTESILRINYADVDNDGDMDIISGQDDSVLALYKNNGDGTFVAPVIFSEPGFSYLLSLEVADIDGDNDIDVLASYNGNEIIWHENDGLGDLSTKHVVIDQMHYPNSVFAADVDGDGDKDLMFANKFYDEVGYFLNTDGQGTFGAPVITSEIPQDPCRIYSLDMDNDGDMDMITNSSQGQRFIWFPNDGAANFGEPIEITSFIERVNHITSADINADGKIDLITSSYDDDKVAWFENLGVFYNNTISGVVRLDANADGCDISDAVIPNLLIQSDNGSNTFSTFTQADGSYLVQANQENFTTAITSTFPTYYASNPTNHTFDFAGLSDTNSDADFCIEANQTINDLNIVIYPDVDEPRPGFETSYRLMYKNNGTTPLSGTIDFQFDDAKMTFLTASETMATPTANTLTFDYNDLIPFETRYIDFTFDVFTLPATNIGDMLHSTVTIHPISGDANEGDNTFDLEQIVIGSYDPNDIRVLEGDKITTDEIDNYLHYIIRFQNTGTASAINVRVNNILDDKFDWSTLQLENLSHEGRVEITNGNNINFIFDNINLPDSNTDEPNSHGFIAYKIKPKNNVVLGDVFMNTADIYFDFNPPIITNTAATKIVNPLPVFITGNLYWDENGNGNYDENEYPIHGSVNLSPETLSFYNNGEFNLSLDSETHILNSETIQHWTLSSDSISYYLDAENLTEFSGYDFGFVPLGEWNRIVGNISSANSICNSFTAFNFSWQNTGNTIISGQVNVLIDNWIDNINFATDIPDNIINPNEFQWDFNNLYPGQTITKTIYLEMPGTADGFTLGESIYAEMDIHYQSTNLQNPLSDSIQVDYGTAVFCNDESNDKLVSPDRVGDENFALLGEPLVYTIRFQNTGNSLVNNIVVKDTLDDNLNVNTFRVFNSSHSEILETTLKENKYLTFTFNGIMLPDSTSDVAGSQGYISYIIEPNEGLDIGTIFENTGHIYFDNHPVMTTNTISNTLTEEIIYGDDIVESCDSLFYNDELFFEDTIVGDTMFLYDGYIINNYTQIIINNSIVQEEDVDILGGESYTLPNGTVVTEAGIYQSDFTTAEGCDSIIITNLTVLVSTLDIEGKKINLEIFPNPSLNDFNIKLENNTKQLNVIIYNSLSQKIATYKMEEYLKINTNSWSKGMYYISIYDNDKFLGVGKVIKVE